MTRHFRIMVTAALAAVSFGSFAAHAQGSGVVDAGSQRITTLETTSLQPVDPDAAGGQTTMAAMPSGMAPAASLVMQAHAQILRPAPLPDQDLDAPGPSMQALAAQQDASLTPSFYSTAKHFSGDGFAAGSTLDEDQSNRHRPGGGMSLSIPVQ